MLSNGVREDINVVRANKHLLHTATEKFVLTGTSVYSADGLLAALQLKHSANFIDVPLALYYDILIPS